MMTVNIYPENPLIESLIFLKYTVSNILGTLVLLFFKILIILPVTKSYLKLFCQYFAAFSYQVTFSLHW